MGQIYLPDANERLLIGVIALVLFFRSSSGLANAYGIAVTGTMVMTSLLAFVVVHRRWGWSLPLAVAVIGFFLVIDLAFLGANILKMFSGGWVPLVFAVGLCLMMLTWNRGRVALSKKMMEESMPTELFLQRLDRQAADPGRRHGDLPDRPGRHAADRLPAQPQAQQGAARAGDLPDGGDRRASRACRARSGCGSRRCAPTSSGSR